MLACSYWPRSSSGTPSGTLGGSCQSADPTFLASEHILAWALGLRGEIVEAEDRFRHLLEERLAVSGPTDPSTLAVRDSLAWMLA